MERLNTTVPQATSMPVVGRLFARQPTCFFIDATAPGSMRRRYTHVLRKGYREVQHSTNIIAPNIPFPSISPDIYMQMLLRRRPALLNQPSAHSPLSPYTFLHSSLLHPRPNLSSALLHYPPTFHNAHRLYPRVALPRPLLSSHPTVTHASRSSCASTPYPSSHAPHHEGLRC